MKIKYQIKTEISNKLSTRSTKRKEIKKMGWNDSDNINNNNNAKIRE